MKKTLALLLGLATISSSVAYADIAPGPGEKDIPSCAMIENLASFPKVTFIAAEYGYNDTSMSITELNDQSCISNKKWSGVELFAINKSDISKYIPSQPEAKPAQGILFAEPAQPSNPRESIDAYTLAKNSPQFSEYGFDRVPNSEADRKQYVHKIYHVIGIDNSMKTFSLALAEEKTAVETKKYDWDADPTAVFEKEVKAETPIFTDVKTDNDYAAAVLLLKKNGYIKGYEDGSYKPENTINRAEFTKIVMHDFTSTKTYDCSKQIFKDVSTDEKNWYRDYVCKAFNEGIIMGFGDNTFRPDQKITFAEAAKIIIKVKKLSTDGATNPWEKEFIDYFKKNKIIPNTIKSQSTEITRGDMALLIRSIIDPVFYSGSPASIIDPVFYNGTNDFEAPEAPAIPAETNLSASIDIHDMAFAPTTLTIKKGTTVTWTNGDPFGHDVISDTGSELVRYLIHMNETYSHTFNDVGTFNYHCAAHPTMKGSVIVTE